MEALSEQEKTLATQLQEILVRPRSTLESVFRSLDTNQDGAVSCEDFLIALEHAGIAICDGSGDNLPVSAVSGDEVAEMLAFFDRDGDGLLKYEEFLHFLETATMRSPDGSPPRSARTVPAPTSDAAWRPLSPEPSADTTTLPGQAVGMRRRMSDSAPAPAAHGARRPRRHSIGDVSTLSQDSDVDASAAGRRSYLPEGYTHTNAPQETANFVRLSLGVTKRGRALGDMGKVRKAFEKWDHDGDGTISNTELHQVLSALDPRFTAEVSRRLFEAADANKDGAIDYQEFIAWLFQRP